MDHACHTSAVPRGGYAVSNPPHQHALTLVGQETLFGVHMTQYHHEMHKYQLVLKLKLPEEAHAILQEMRRSFPDAFFVLCNSAHDQFTIPELASGRRRSFTSDVFQGLPPFTEKEEAAEGEHFFPWSAKRARPLVANVEVEVARVVAFRPFAHHYEAPPCATYLLFGEADEAHMTSLQTARLTTGPFEAPLFGPDFDHVMSLKRAPDWLDPLMLEAGIVVTTPALRLRDPETGKPVTPSAPPFQPGERVIVLYRGMGEPLQVEAGCSSLFATAVCNSAGLDLGPAGPVMCVSETPPELRP